MLVVGLVLGGELEELGGMRGSIEVESAVLEVITGPQVLFGAEQVGHEPMMFGKAGDGEVGVALAGGGSEVDDSEGEAVVGGAGPLEGEEVFVGGVFWPGGVGWEGGEGSGADEGVFEGEEEGVIEALDFGVGRRVGAALELDGDLGGMALELGFVDEA